jgi:hypothetical protein
MARSKSERRKRSLDLEARTELEPPFHWPGWHAPAEKLPAETPHDRLKVHRAFRSRILPDRRDLIVYLPPQYEAEPDRKFPVLYLHDGQNLFDPATSFIKGRTWKVRESADAAIGVWPSTRMSATGRWAAARPIPMDCS